MKKFKVISLLILLVIGLYSCKKEEAEKNAMDFKFTGSTDTIVGLGENFKRDLNIIYLGGDIEEVYFTSSSLPAGVEIKYSPDKSKPGAHIEQQIIVSATADTGIFNIIAIATGTGGKIFQKKFNLRIPAVTKYAPIIHLAGTISNNISLNSGYFEAGYTASDVEDGDLTSQVTVTNPVNINLAGSYSIKYEVTDSDGNTTTIYRLVNVLNSINYLSNTYNCTYINLQSGQTHNWISSITASDTLNYSGKIFKISDYFLANPVFTLNPFNDSIFVAPQSFLSISPTDTLIHTFEGRGKVSVGGSHISIVLIYTDTYTDPVSGLIVLNKKDVYSI